MNANDLYGQGPTGLACSNTPCGILQVQYGVQAANTPANQASWCLLIHKQHMVHTPCAAAAPGAHLSFVSCALPAANN